MSGSEALGIVASATQLAAYGIKIVLHLNELSEELRSAPLRTRQYLNQVRELIETATLIEQHKYLQSPKLYTHLKSTILEAQSLFEFLRQLSKGYTGSTLWRFWAILKSVDQQKILASLDKLEREKSALILCINLVQTDLLVGVQSSIDSISCSDMPTNPGDRSTRAYTGGTSTVGSTDGTAPRDFRLIGGQKIPFKMKPQDQNNDKPKEKSVAASETGQSSTKTDGSSSSEGHTYSNVYLTGNSTAINGNQNSNDSNVPQRNHKYGNLNADSSSSHVNGDQNGDEAIKLVHHRS